MVCQKAALLEHMLHTAIRRQAALGEKGASSERPLTFGPRYSDTGKQEAERKWGGWFHIQKELETDKLLLSVTSDQHGSFL